MNSSDNIISRFIFFIIFAIVGYWIVLWGIDVWNWYVASGGYSPEWWPQLGAFLLRNFSIVVVLYGMACMQASGLAELKFGKNFLVALGLAFILTPPIMMVVYGKKQQ